VPVVAHGYRCAEYRVQNPIVLAKVCAALIVVEVACRVNSGPRDDHRGVGAAGGGDDAYATRACSALRWPRRPPAAADTARREVSRLSSIVPSAVGPRRGDEQQVARRWEWR